MALFWGIDMHQGSAQYLAMMSHMNSMCCCAVALRDEMRVYLPTLLPKFVALFGEAERGGGYDMVRPALSCLEALGTALEDHLPLLLPALVRLIHPSTASRLFAPPVVTSILCACAHQDFLATCARAPDPLVFELMSPCRA
jgi:hypothetical protein